MNQSLRLEAFGLAAEAADGPVLPQFGRDLAPHWTPKDDPDPPPDQALETAYDLGYQTGVAARDHEIQTSNLVIAAELRETLNTLAFTFHEARNHVLSSLTPLLRTMVSTVLPYLARRGWADSVIAELTRLAFEAADAPVTLLVAPEAESLLAPALADAGLGAFHLAADPALTPHQATFRFGDCETLLDLDGVLATIEARVTAYLNALEKDKMHG